MSPHTNEPSSVESYSVQFSSLDINGPPRSGSHGSLYPPRFYGHGLLDGASDSEEDLVHRPLVPGVYVPTLTFFYEQSEDLDLATIGNHAVHLAEAGVAGLATMGSNGEAVHLSHSERKVVTATTRKALDNAGFHYMPIIVGCGAQSTRETVELCHDAMVSGGDYALVLPPSYYRPLFKSESLIEFFNEVADASPIPILIYNYPGAASGIDLDSDAIIKLSKHPNIVGCKLTCGNTGKLARIAAATSPSGPSEVGSSFITLGGSADFTLQTLIAGGAGIIGGLGNVAPKACVRLVNLYYSGNFKEARKLQAVVARGDWAAITGGIVGTKSALMSYLGYGGYARRPLPRPTASETAKYESDFQEILTLEDTL